MCRKCRDKCQKDCRDNRCVREVVISALPYTINQSGTYCLCRDFEWDANGTGAAILIENTDNVVLKFNTKKITVTDASLSTADAVIQVNDSKDVTLLDVHIVSAEGISTTSVFTQRSSVVRAVRPVIFGGFKGLDFRGNLATGEVYDNIQVLDAQIITQREALIPGFPANRGIQTVLVRNVKIKGFDFVNANIILFETDNLDVSDGRIEFEGEGPVGGSVNVQPYVRFTERPKSNAILSRIETIGNGRIAIAGIAKDQLAVGVPSQDVPMLNTIIENCTCEGLIVQNSIGSTVRENQVSTNLLEQAAIEILGSKDVLITQNNMVKNFKEGPPGSEYGGVFLFGISQANGAISFSVDNVVSNNTVRGCEIGYSDNNTLFINPPDTVTKAQYTLFQDNVAIGNCQQFLITDVTTVLVDNTEVHKKDCEPVAEQAVVAVAEKTTKSFTVNKLE